jgi:Protein of unknown function (DUF1573)
MYTRTLSNGQFARIHIKNANAKERQLIMLFPTLIPFIIHLQVPSPETELISAYSALRSFECLISRENQLHGTREKFRLRFRSDGKLRVDYLGDRNDKTTESPLIGRLLSKEPTLFTNMRPDGDEVLQGVPTHRFLATLDNTEVRLWIGVRDGLLRRYCVLGSGNLPTLTESYTAVRVNPDLADSLFAPHAPRPIVPSIPITPTSSLSALPTISERFDLGKLSPVDNPTVTHDFTFVNHTEKPIKLIRAQGSCGCLSTLLGTTEVGEVLVAPGQSTPIQVRVALLGLAPGPLQKSVSVFAEGVNTPIARYDLAGQVLPSILFEPAALNFAPNSPNELPFDIIVDERLLQKEKMPDLVSPQGLLEIVAQSSKNGTLELREGIRVRHFSFVARLSPTAPLGSQVGRLGFSQTTRSDSPLWKSVGATIVAQIQGDVTAMPSAVVFGAVTATGDTEQTFQLTYKANASANRKIITDSPFLKIETMPSTGKEASETIWVRLLGTCPNGIFQNSLQVHLKNGQVLVVPISAYIQRPATTIKQEGKGDK